MFNYIRENGFVFNKLIEKDFVYLNDYLGVFSYILYLFCNRLDVYGYYLLVLNGWKNGNYKV